MEQIKMLFKRQDISERSGVYHETVLFNGKKFAINIIGNCYEKNITPTCNYPEFRNFTYIDGDVSIMMVDGTWTKIFPFTQIRKENEFISSLPLEDEIRKAVFDFKEYIINVYGEIN